MSNFKYTLAILFALNTIGVILSALHYFDDQDRVLETQEFTPINTSVSDYKFDDPTTAYYVLEALDTNERPNSLVGIGTLHQNNLTRRFHMGLTTDDQYCQNHRALFVNDPQSVFTTVKIFSDYEQNSTLKTKIFADVGVNIQSNIGTHMDRSMKQAEIFDIRTDATVFFCRALYVARQVGKQFSCLTQMSNHIPGNILLTRKDYGAEAIAEYKKSYETRPQCLDSNKFFPTTYLMTKKDQCESFFNHLDSPQYQELKNERNIVYIRKVAVGAHAAGGLSLVDEKEEYDLRKLYRNGELCGEITKNYIVQKLIHNPLLFNGHKFDFRAFMLIASTNPTITYYHDGVIWLSTEKYDSNSKDRAGFLPNASFNKTVLEKLEKEGTYHGKNMTQLQEETTKFYADLQDYLLEKGIISDPNWIDNYLRPEFKKAMVHMIRMGQAPFLKSSSVYELLGFDFMLDTDLNVWFIEANVYPSFEEYTQKEGDFMRKLAVDHFEIINGLLRSRTKRIINYVNNLTRNYEAWYQDDKAYFDDQEQRTLEFKGLSKNWFEPEFEPSLSNGFVKIVDDNLDGMERYSGLLSEECL